MACTIIGTSHFHVITSLLQTDISRFILQVAEKARETCIVKLCSIPLLEAEADARVYPPFAGQVGSEVSRVGSVQVCVPA